MSRFFSKKFLFNIIIPRAVLRYCWSLALRPSVRQKIRLRRLPSIITVAGVLFWMVWIIMFIWPLSHNHWKFLPLATLWILRVINLFAIIHLSWSLIWRIKRIQDELRNANSNYGKYIGKKSVRTGVDLRVYDKNAKRVRGLRPGSKDTVGSKYGDINDRQGARKGNRTDVARGKGTRG